jgi:hypothetical protein
LRVRKAGKKVKKILRKNNSKSDKTHPDPNYVTLSARSASATATSVKANGNKRFYI